jgi:hypothetical protein
MTTRFKALATLVLSAPLLTELASGNTPAHAFLNPRVSLFLLMAYGLPVLIIREAALRRGLSLAGVFLLGLAYGILNEGLLAQTLLRFENVPINKFDHYIYAAGFNFSWAVVIVPWHALFAVIFPIALVSYWFPACAKSSWLGKRVFLALTGILAAMILFIGMVRPPHPQMRAFILGMAVLAGVGCQVRRGNEGNSRSNMRGAIPFLFGAAAYLVFFLGTITLAAKRVQPAIYFIAAAIIFAGLVVVSTRFHFLDFPAFARLALGAYVVVAIFNFLGGVRKHSAEAAVTGGLLAVIFLLLAMVQRRIAPPTPVC